MIIFILGCWLYPDESDALRKWQAKAHLFSLLCLTKYGHVVTHTLSRWHRWRRWHYDTRAVPGHVSEHQKTNHRASCVRVNR